MAMTFRKGFLLLCCLLLCLLLTGCYTDVDPWPKSGETVITPMPSSTSAPTLEPMEDWVLPVPSDTPLPMQPPVTEAPGFNG